MHVKVTNTQTLNTIQYKSVPVLSLSLMAYILSQPPIKCCKTCRLPSSLVPCVHLLIHSSSRFNIRHQFSPPNELITYLHHGIIIHRSNVYTNGNMSSLLCLCAKLVKLSAV